MDATIQASVPWQSEGTLLVAADATGDSPWLVSTEMLPIAMEDTASDRATAQELSPDPEDFDACLMVKDASIMFCRLSFMVLFV